MPREERRGRKLTNWKTKSKNPFMKRKKGGKDVGGSDGGTM